MSACEWHPAEDRPALRTDAPHGEATISVGSKPNWHLCADCAELPAFKRKRRRIPLAVAAAAVQWPEGGTR